MAHIHEKIDWTVQVFIVYKDKVLIRKHDKYEGWFGVGGHIELDEDPVQAAKRECLEEVGLEITLYGEETYTEIEKGWINIPSPVCMNRHRINDTHEHIDCIYFAESQSDSVVPEKESDTWLWLTGEGVLAHTGITEGVKKYALAALKIFEK
jgi:8-oxo-dGTP pyrophosphatase MutT (NUDIX family)